MKNLLLAVLIFSTLIGIPIIFSELKYSSITFVGLGLSWIIVMMNSLRTTGREY